VEKKGDAKSILAKTKGPNLIHGNNKLILGKRFGYVTRKRSAVFQGGEKETGICGHHGKINGGMF